MKSFRANPVLKTDFYKQSHRAQYPEGTNLVFSNWTARGSRLRGLYKTIHFGAQAAVQKIVEDFDDNFFGLRKKDVVESFVRRLRNSLGGSPDASHVEALHDLGYLPICVYSLPEGASVPLRVPSFCMWNTIKEFGWLTNFLETSLSANTWGPMTSATTANIYRKILTHYAKKTNPEAEGFVAFQGHDFSYRGMFSDEAACQSGGGHLTSFSGTDTIPAIDWLEHYYHADSDKELIGASVPASEHSCACLGTAYESSLLPDEINETYEYWDYINCDS